MVPQLVDVGQPGTLVHAIGDEGLQVQAGLTQAAYEEQRLVHGGRLGGQHQHERDVRSAQALGHALRAGQEAAQHSLEVAQERRDVLQELAAHELRQPFQNDGAARPQPPQREPPGVARRTREPLQRRAGDGLGQAMRRFEKIQRVRRGGRVQHDQIELVAAHQVVQRQRRRVFL